MLYYLSHFIVVVITALIVSIITEHMVIQRFQLSEGVQITNGRCRLLPGYGKLETNNQQTTTNAPIIGHQLISRRMMNL